MGKKARLRAERRANERLHAPRGPGRWLRRRTWLVGLLVVLLVIGGVGAWQWNSARTATLEPAPRFNLMASNGKVLTLDDFVGRQEVVLIFYMGAG